MHIELSQRAQKFLSKLDKHIKKRIEERLKKLREMPVPSDAKFIGRTNQKKLFRYRIGEYRVLYLLKGNILIITKIDKRSRVYD